MTHIGAEVWLGVYAIGPVLCRESSLMSHKADNLDWRQRILRFRALCLPPIRKNSLVGVLSGLAAKMSYRATLSL